MQDELRIQRGRKSVIFLYGIASLVVVWILYCLQQDRDGEIYYLLYYFYRRCSMYIPCYSGLLGGLLLGIEYESETLAQRSLIMSIRKMFCIKYSIVIGSTLLVFILLMAGRYVICGNGIKGESVIMIVLFCWTMLEGALSMGITKFTQRGMAGVMFSVALFLFDQSIHIPLSFLKLVESVLY